MLLKTKVYETGFGHMKKKDLMIFLKKLLVIKYMKMFQDVLIKVTVDEKKILFSQIFIRPSSQGSILIQTCKAMNFVNNLL